MGHIYNVMCFPLGLVEDTLIINLLNFSVSAGSVSAGNLQKYLPFILSEIQANPKRQYLLLHSLKEVITCHYGSTEAVATLHPQVANIW